MATEVRNEAVILRAASPWPDERKWDYEAQCMRCGKQINGERTSTWASKAPAEKRAKEHMERHARMDDWLQRQLTSEFRTVELVGTVTA